MSNSTTPRSIVGIDVSKDKLDVHILCKKESFKLNYNQKELNLFIKKLIREHSNPILVMENTGGFEKTLYRLATKHGVPVHIAHSNRIYHFAKQKGYFGKTDKQDAIIIAHYAAQEGVEPTPTYCTDSVTLRELSNRRGQIVDDLHDEKCRLSRPIQPSVKRSIERKIKFLENEKELIEKEIRGLIEASPEKAQVAKRLQTFKGVGPAIAQGFVALLPELGTLGRNQIAAILGVAPKNNESGHKQGRRRIVGGRFNARRLLYMGALVACKYNPELKKVYQRLIAKGKPAKVAIVAVMRKMIITLNAMIRDKKDWVPVYEGT